MEGETLQAQAVKDNNFTREIYARIIALKTAALFQAAGEIGARLANAKPEIVDALAQYAYSLGMAFQIVDDILDVVGDEAKLGKTAHIDADQGRGFISIKDAASSSANHSTADVMDNVKRKLMEGNRLQEARDQARAFVEMAIMQLNVLPESDARQELVSLAESVINRDH